MYILKDFISNTLPHSDIKPNIYNNVNNKAELEIISNNGIPYGAVTRIILLYITTQINLQKSKKIFLGNSFSDFMKRCGFQVSGGKNGSISTCKEQWKRILSCSFSTSFDGKKIAFRFFQTTDEFNGFIEIDDTFYNHFIKNKIYIEDEHIKKLKNAKHGALVLDLYFWLIYRRYTLKKPTNLKYKDLQNQFGTGIEDLSVFKAKLKQAFIVLSTVLNLHTSFYENVMNVIDFSVKSALSKVSKFQKYLKGFTFVSKHRIKIEFKKDAMFLSYDFGKKKTPIFV